MINILLVLYFHGTKNYQCIFLFDKSVSNICYTVLYYTMLYYTILSCIYIYIYIICTPSQYLTRGGIERIRGTRSDKSISSNLEILKAVRCLCDLESFILNNNYFENEELKYHQKRGFAIAAKFAHPYSNLFMVGL